MVSRIGFSEDEENEIVQMYLAGKDQVQIAKYFNTYNTSIRRVLLRKRIKILSTSERNRAIIPTFFDNYDDPNIQYWLGVLASDGCITGEKLIFEAKDKEWVEAYRNFLNPNININTTQPKKGHTLYRVSCRVKGIEWELLKYGIVANKSLKLKWKMPLTNHFIRGVFDGDGSAILSDKIKYVRISICGASEVFLKQIQDYFTNNNIHSTIYASNRPDKNTLYTLSIHNIKDKQNLYHLFYDDAEFFLKRKKENFETILSQTYIREAKTPVQLNENGKTIIFNTITKLQNYLGIDRRKLAYWLQKGVIIEKGYNVKYL